MAAIDAREAGFSLLEMLVAVALMALLAGVASMSLFGDPTRAVRQEAERLQQALQLAADEAVFQGVEVGAVFSPSSYHFVRYDAGSGRWQPVSGKALQLRRLPEGLRLGLSLSSKPVTPKGDHPAVIFLSSGEMTAFTASISNRDNSVVLIGTDGISPIAPFAGAMR